MYDTKSVRSYNIHEKPVEGLLQNYCNYCQENSMLTMHTWLFLNICFIKLSTYIADSMDTMIFWVKVTFAEVMHHFVYLLVILTKHLSATPQVFN